MDTSARALIRTPKAFMHLVTLPRTVALHEEQRQQMRSDNGDTLIEILVALVVLGLTGLALLGAFASAIGGSATYRRTVTGEVILKDFAESATEQIQLSSTPIFTPCATLSGYASAPHHISYGTTQLSYEPPSGYSITIAPPEYFNSDGTLGACAPSQYQPQLITATVTGPNGAKSTLAFVVTDPNLVS